MRGGRDVQRGFQRPLNAWSRGGVDAVEQTSAKSRPSASTRRRAVAGYGVRLAPPSRSEIPRCSGRRARPTPPAIARPPDDDAKAAARRRLVRFRSPCPPSAQHTLVTQSLSRSGACTVRSCGAFPARFRRRRLAQRHPTSGDFALRDGIHLQRSSPIGAFRRRIIMHVRPVLRTTAARFAKRVCLRRPAIHGPML
jgi:hypothetical protein